MGSDEALILCSLLLLSAVSYNGGLAAAELEGITHHQTAALLEVDASPSLARKIPETLFGLFFEEINHAGAGGIWAELVSNRGFEAGGPHTPSNIDPWNIIGDESSIYVMTDRVSRFNRNIVALRMEVLCDKCPAGGVGIYNPGFWGMGHGFRTELISMLLDLKPRFLRFPGGCFVEGNWLRNAFRWKETIGPWEERPGNYGDVWNYWTDDGLGYYEFLQLAEDLGAAPVWVINAGISHNDAVDTTKVKCKLNLDVIDSLEFARGSADSTWGSVRAAMGHPDPFPVKYVAIGNENCKFKFYRGNYIMFYNAIREAYPDIQMISNCDSSIIGPLNHPADLYDVHIYTSDSELFRKKNTFDTISRIGPKAFISEYAVKNDRDPGNATLLASLAEAAFLIGLENNRCFVGQLQYFDIVQMASYGPLFVNDNDRTWLPDAIVFNSWQQYGTPSYWMQTFFRESSGALIHPFTIASSYSNLLAASVITWQNTKNSILRVKIVNFGPDVVNLTICANGLQADVNTTESSLTVLTSSNSLDGNSFDNPNKVVPVASVLPNAAEEMQAVVSPYSLTSFDLALD